MANDGNSPKTDTTLGQMKIDRLQSWLGIISNVAIVLGLIALAVEIRGNSQALRSQQLAENENFEKQRQLLLASDRDLTALYMKSLYEPSELTLEDLHRITYYLVARVDTLWKCYDTYSEGTTTRNDWESCLNFAPMYLGGRFARVWWDFIKTTDYASAPEFVAAVDAALNSNDTAALRDETWFLRLEQLVREAEW